MYKNLLPRFIDYVKKETRSNDKSNTVPSTVSQVEFAHDLEKELKDLGMSAVHYNNENGFLTAEIPSNSSKKIRSVGFIAHLDTADFNATNVQPQVIENYDGVSSISLDEEGIYTLNIEDFPNLSKYKDNTLVTTDGSTLLGADDKAGIAEIITAMEFFLTHPEIEHGVIKVAFGPDEEIGTGANKFDAKGFATDVAYTLDGGPLGELEYETFNAARADITFLGKNVHPGTAKDKMVNAVKLAIEFNSYLPENEVPEKTDNYEGFFHITELAGTEEEAHSSYIIRDHDHDSFNQRKKLITDTQEKMNKEYGQERVIVDMFDQYYNMKEIIEEDMSVVEIPKKAMENLQIEPIMTPVRGGTDGSKISFMGIPTPNIFAGGENMHGRYEFVSLQTMEKATDVIIEIVKLYAVEA